MAQDDTAALAASLAAWGILAPAQVVALAAAAGLELAAAATLLEKESGGGANVWGHDPVDTGGLYVKGAPVTREAYLAWRPRRGELGAQGVGPCQLTWRGYQDQADQLGGCWDPGPNMRVGFAALASLQRQYGERGGFRQYNGSGPAAEAYADDAMGRLARWRDRLGPTAPPPPAPPLPSPPGPVVFLRLGSRGPEVAALQRVLNAWYPRDLVPPLAVDGAYGPATAAAVRLCQGRAGLTVDGIAGPATQRVLGL